MRNDGVMALSGGTHIRRGTVILLSRAESAWSMNIMRKGVAILLLHPDRQLHEQKRATGELCFERRRRRTCCCQQDQTVFTVSGATQLKRIDDVRRRLLFEHCV